MKFLLNKIKKYSPFYLLRLELEAWIFMLFSPFPGSIGFILRWMVGKIFFKISKGFQWIQPGVIIVHADKISIGRNVGINSFCYINGVGGIQIEDFVTIGNNVTISSGRHPTEGKDSEIFEKPIIPMAIHIEKGVWIGAGAVIMPGIKLGRGCVIGANSVIIKDTDPYSINVGIPGQNIGCRQ